MLSHGGFEAALKEAWDIGFLQRALAEAQATSVDKRFEASHRLGFHRGLIFCLRCGAWSTGERPQLLTKPCRGHLCTGSALPKILRGHSPLKGGKWPTDEVPSFS